MNDLSANLKAHCLATLEMHITKQIHGHRGGQKVNVGTTSGGKITLFREEPAKCGYLSKLESTMMEIKDRTATLRITKNACAQRRGRGKGVKTRCF